MRIGILGAAKIAPAKEPEPAVEEKNEEMNEAANIVGGDPNVAATLNAFTDMAAETDPKKKLKKLKR